MSSDRIIRLRLVLGATVFAAIALGVALVTGRILISSALHSAAEELAASDLAPYLADLAAHPGEPPDPPAAGVLLGIQTPDGRWLIDTLPDEVSSALDDQQGDPRVLRIEADDSSWVVVGARTASSDGEVRLWAARDESAATASLRTIDLGFVIGGVALLALFAFASTLFVRVALHPVEQARRRERRFVSDAAHEIRTPLTALRAQLALVRRTLDRPAAADRELGRAEDAAGRLADLASNLLELARLDETPRSGHADAAHLRTAFLTAVDDIRSTPTASTIDIEQISPAEMPEAVADLDEISFARIVQNLLANAVRAVSPSGTVVAELSATSASVMLIVRDDGPGMPAEFLNRAGQRFARPTADPGPGSGLGLALVDALARSAGGDVGWQNTAPGLRVEVRIPLRPKM